MMRRPTGNFAGRRRAALLVTLNLTAVAIYFVSFGHGIGLGGYHIDLDVYRTGARVLLRGGDLYGRLPRPMRWPTCTRYIAAAARFKLTSSADRRRPVRFTADRILARQVLAGPRIVRMVISSGVKA